MFFFSETFSQAPNTAKQVKKLMKEADFYFEQGEYFNALREYNKVLAIDPRNDKANLNALISHLKEHQPVDSVLDLAGHLQANSKIPEVLFYLGTVNHLLKNFDVALDYFKKYRTIESKKRKIQNDEVDYMMGVCENAKVMMSRPHRAIIKNMGDEINSKWDDYVPIINSGETVMYFTSRRAGSSSNTKDSYGNYHEDIYVSHNTNGVWEKPKNIGKPLNTDLNDASVALNYDGKKMIIFRTAPNIVTGHLMYSEKINDDEWSEPQMYGKEINSQFIETSACFSTDTSELYFSSTRPGGYGGKDIYRIKRLPNGRWSQPFNLGPNINTSYDDDAPFFHPDGVTMFFSSKGHNTMGNYDVFMSVLNKETNVFTKAENVGYPVNSVNNDIFFVLSADGKRGYYSSMKEDTRGEEDIYFVDTRFGDNDIVIKHGMILRDKTPGKAKITLLDNDTRQVAGIYTANSGSGKFILAINPMVSYKVIIEETGYNSVVLELEPAVNDKEEKEITVNLTKKTD